MIVLILGLDKILNTNMIDFSVFNNWLVIFPIIFLIVVADKVFYEWFKIQSKTRIISFIEFLIVSAVVYWILSRDGLKQLLLSYPEFIIIIFILNILVGRFTWLQLLEYFRFIPLLEKESNSEIEEE
jgi:DNA integrity scanning protein DisA with diadenylate cyclase activity